MKTDAPRIMSIKSSFQLNSAPKELRRFSLAIVSGRAASKVPAGQMNLQKAGTPVPVTR